MMTDRHATAASSENDADSGDLFLKPNEPRVFTFSFLPLNEDVGKQIEVGLFSF